MGTNYWAGYTEDANAQRGGTGRADADSRNGGLLNSKDYANLDESFEDGNKCIKCICGGCINKEHEVLMTGTPDVDSQFAPPPQVGGEDQEQVPDYSEKRTKTKISGRNAECKVGRGCCCGKWVVPIAAVGLATAGSLAVFQGLGNIHFDGQFNDDLGLMGNASFIGLISTVVILLVFLVWGMYCSGNKAAYKLGLVTALGTISLSAAVAIPLLMTNKWTVETAAEMPEWTFGHYIGLSVAGVLAVGFIAYAIYMCCTKKVTCSGESI